MKSLVQIGLLLGKGAETLAQDLRTLHDINEGAGIDNVEHRAQLDHIRTVQGDIDHLALIALIEAAAGDAGATALQVVDDIVADGLRVVGDDKHGPVALHTIDDQVDDLALDEDDEDRIDGKTDVTKGDECAQGDDAVNNHDESTQGNLGVLVDNHRDDVRTATGSTRTENETNGNAIDETGEDGVEEIVGLEPAAIVGNLHHAGAFYLADGAVMNHWIISPHALEHKGGSKYQYRGDDGLDTELGSKDPSADNQQRDIHADGIQRNLHLGRSLARF